MSSVLIVDDDPGIRRIAKIALSVEGDNVLLACDGLEALDILCRESIDLMVVDLLMPRMDGRLTIAEARREGYRGPVLIVSGYETKAVATDLSAEGVLEKPFELFDFLSCVHDLLNDPHKQRGPSPEREELREERHPTPAQLTGSAQRDPGALHDDCA
jgi:two-component system, OmpR family, response regulator MprA